MKKRNVIFWLCLAGAAALLMLGLTVHWAFWIAMAFLILGGILLRK